jgi:cytochrome c-type biogenesis protein CcmH
MNDPSMPQATIAMNTIATDGKNRVRLAVIVGCLLLLVGALVVGKGNTSNSIRARTDRIASDIKCPTCQGLSVKQSSAGTAKAIYSEIERQVVEGQSDASIRGYLVSRFGTEQLLRPESTGIGSIVWIAPVVFVVLAITLLALAFARWSRKAKLLPNVGDEALIAAFRAARQNPSTTQRNQPDQPGQAGQPGQPGQIETPAQSEAQHGNATDLVIETSVKPT